MTIQSQYPQIRDEPLGMRIQHSAKVQCHWLCCIAGHRTQTRACATTKTFQIARLPGQSGRIYLAYLQIGLSNSTAYLLNAAYLEASTKWGDFIARHKIIAYLEISIEQSKLL